MAQVCKVAELFLLERKYSQATSEEAGGKQPTGRSLSPSNGDFVRHHEEQGVVSLAEQKYGNKPRMSSVRSPTEMICSA